MKYTITWTDCIIILTDCGLSALIDDASSAQVRRVQMTVTVGGSVSLSCSSNITRTFRWYFRRSDRVQPEVAGISIEPESNANYGQWYRVHFDASIGRSELIIKDVRYADAGIFSCRDWSNDAGVGMAIELSVRGTGTSEASDEADLSTVLSAAMMSISAAALCGLCLAMMKRFHQSRYQRRKLSVRAAAGFEQRCENIYHDIYTSTCGVSSEPQLYAELKPRYSVTSSGEYGDQLNVSIDSYEDVHEYLEVTA